MPRKIVVKITNKEIPKLKSILSLKEGEFTGMTVTGLMHGNLGDDIISSFNVDDNHYNVLIKKLVINQIRMLAPDDNVLQVIKNARPDLPQELKPIKGITWKELKEKNAATPAGSYNIESLIRSGSYETLIEISRDIKHDHNLVEQAKNGAAAAAFNAVEMNYNMGLRNKYEAGRYIAELVKIGTDSRLKSLRLFEVTKSAGLKAVELCEKHYDYRSELVKISNNNLLPNIVNTTAAAVFSRLVMNDESESENLQYALKNLNVRWLLIAYDIVEVEMDSTAREYFNSLISYIKSKR